MTGATGYLGRRLVAELCARGHHVRALARPGSEHKLPADVEVVTGDALDAESYRARVAACDTFVHLVGVAHPNPSKAALFRSVDLASAEATVSAADALLSAWSSEAPYLTTSILQAALQPSRLMLLPSSQVSPSSPCTILSPHLGPSLQSLVHVP